MLLPKHMSQPLLFWLSLVRFQYVQNWSQILNKMEYLPKQLPWPQAWGQTQSHPVHSHRLPISGFFPKQGGEREEVGRGRRGALLTWGNVLPYPFGFQPSTTNCSAWSKCYAGSGATAVVPERLYVLLGTGLAQHTRAAT